jgi:hypothetical protein
MSEPVGFLRGLERATSALALCVYVDVWVGLMFTLADPSHFSGSGYRRLRTDLAWLPGEDGIQCFGIIMLVLAALVVTLRLALPRWVSVPVWVLFWMWVWLDAIFWLNITKPTAALLLPVLALLAAAVHLRAAIFRSVSVPRGLEGV